MLPPHQHSEWQSTGEEMGPIASLFLSVTWFGRVVGGGLSMEFWVKVSRWAHPHSHDKGWRAVPTYLCQVAMHLMDCIMPWIRALGVQQPLNAQCRL